MTYRGYPEQDLVTNRSSLFLYGSTEAERRLWAEEAAQNFAAEGALRVAHTGDELRAAMEQPRGVVYVPDAAAIDEDAQRHLVYLIHARADRPKVILGLNGTPDAARDAGKLRVEVHYALQLAHVNLDAPGAAAAIRSRRARAPKKPQAAAKQKPAPASRPAAKAKSAARAKPKSAAKPTAKAKAKKAPKPAARKPAPKKKAAKPAARRRR